MPNRAKRRAAERAKFQQASVQPSVSEAQLNANRANAKLSTGPVTPDGFAAIRENRTTHGLARHNGSFFIHADENAADFKDFSDGLFEEHQPTTPTETILVRSMVESHWLANRALRLADTCYDHDTHLVADEKMFALYHRYHLAHSRAFHKSLNDFLKLRAEKRKAVIGFEAQKLKYSAAQRAAETLELKKQIFEWQKEVAQAKKKRASAPAPAQTDAETAPATQKMAA